MISSERSTRHNTRSKFIIELLRGVLEAAQSTSKTQKIRTVMKNNKLRSVDVLVLETLETSKTGKNKR